MFHSLVPPQTPEEIADLVKDFLYKEFDNSGSRNTLKVDYKFGALPWIGDKDHWNFQAAYEATKVRAVVAYVGGNTWITTTTLTGRLWGKACTLLYARGGDCPPGVYSSE